MKGEIKGHGWSHYVKSYEPKREKLNLGSSAPYFKDGKLNRDAHGAPSGPAVIKSEAKEVHIYHHRDKDD